MGASPPPDFATHAVTNQVPPLADTQAFDRDPALTAAVSRLGGGWHAPALRALGAATGSAELREHGRLANAHPPALKSFDRYGNRVNQVDFHPSYHHLMATSMAHRLHSLPWVEDRDGRMVARCAATYLMSQVEPGHGCPITMTFAAVPALRHQPDVAAEWIPRITAAAYDPRDRPAAEKSACTIGMAMTEKQGGSDVRRNTTSATPLGAGGPGQPYTLVGHKWFCSAPMCDAFLTLAYTDVGLSCFLVPRWRPDGGRNAMHIQRLKDKLGNRSNASSEIEYAGAWAVMVGPEGRGVPTIIEMVGHTRLDCVIGSAALLRRALTEAVHHARHRSAFGARLIEHGLMQNVLADLALESEAALALGMRLAQAFDDGRHDPAAAAFARIATAAGKYLVCKRAPGAIFEAMECLGGNGYAEESGMPLLYREAPVNSIWEGSGNVMCLDVLRAMHKEPESVAALTAELQGGLGRDDRYDRFVQALLADLSGGAGQTWGARRRVEQIGLAVQARQLLEHAPAAVSEAFLASRLAGDRLGCFGTLPAGVDADAILERALPVG